jgi:hypothetical protein
MCAYDHRCIALDIRVILPRFWHAFGMTEVIL